MGYSCTTKASMVMEAIMQQNRHENSGNEYKGRHGKLYFWERGRENHDGAMTGTIILQLDNGLGRRAGSFRIEPDGHITRFPGLTKKQRETAEAAGLRRFKEVFEQGNHGAVFD